MFGGEFGAFGTRDRHFFNESHPTYRALQDLAHLRNYEVALRRGSQLLREVSIDGTSFAIPTTVKGSNPPRLDTFFAWSRIYDGVEMLCVINTSITESSEAWVALDGTLDEQNKANETPRAMKCVYPYGNETTSKVKVLDNGRKAVRIEVPPHSIMVFKSTASGNSSYL
jgi:hypothetical protein